ncbi:MAG: MarR family transcriptional regulator [Micropepsaceae bacterium]
MTQVFSPADRLKPAPRKARPAHGVRQDDKERFRSELEAEIALGWLLHDVHRLFGKDFEDRIKDLGLTRAQWRVLMTLERTDGGQTQTELADLTEIEKAPLGKTLDRLEEGGWIVRKDDPADRRARRVYATAKIDKFFPQLAAAAKGTFARTLQGVRQNEVKDLIARLQKLKRNLGGAED